MGHTKTYFETSTLVKWTDRVDVLGQYRIMVVLYKAFIPTEQFYHIDLCQRIAGLAFLCVNPLPNLAGFTALKCQRDIGACFFHVF